MEFLIWHPWQNVEGMWQPCWKEILTSIVNEHMLQINEYIVTKKYVVESESVYVLNDNVVVEGEWINISGPKWNR